MSENRPPDNKTPLTISERHWLFAKDEQSQLSLIRNQQSHHMKL